MHPHEQYEIRSDTFDPQMFKFHFSNLTNTILFESHPFSEKINIFILDATIDYTLSTKRFDKLFSE